MSHKWVIKGSHVRWRGLPVRGRPRRAACSLGTGADASAATAEAARATRYADPAPALPHGVRPPAARGSHGPRGGGGAHVAAGGPSGGSVRWPGPRRRGRSGWEPGERGSGGAGTGGWEDPHAASAPSSPRARRSSPGPGPGRAQLVGWPSVCETHLWDKGRAKGTAFKTRILFLFF